MVTTCFSRRSALFLSALVMMALFAACAQKPSSPNYFPEVGGNAVHQRALEVRSNLKVLSVSLRPGYEDFATLAYLRLARGAVLMSVYATNGEAGESDVQGEYPFSLAATRRAEAVAAMHGLDGDARFLNLPDIVAARDTAQVRQLWPSDSLRLKLGEFIAQFRPDLILLNRDWSSETGSPVWEILRADLLAAVNNAVAGKIVDLAKGANGGLANWTVSRVVIDHGGTEGLRVPWEEKHPRWKKSYAQIGEAAAQAYASLAVQRKFWRQGKTPAYVVGYPMPAPPSLKTIAEGLPWPVSQRLRSLEIQLEALTEKTFNGQTREVLPRLAALIDSIEFTIALNQLTLTAGERKSLLQWKGALENLRCSLLGVEVYSTITDTMLTDYQLTYVFVNEVKGLSREGKTDILFAGLDQTWAVNEDVSKKLPLKLKEEYRLLTPKGLVYNYPPSQTPFQLTPFAKSVLMFVIHQAKAKAQNFIYRRTFNLNFAPRFVAEVMTPIVRVTPDERVVIRLMNNSRDGVADTVEVTDSLAHSFRHPFRLSQKGATMVDTLTLSWNEDLPEGTYTIPVSIDGLPVARFAARKFAAEVDRTKRLGLVTGINRSPTAEALRRLNLNFALVTADQNFVQRIAALDVLIIDRRALSLLPQLAALRQELDRFVERGGHLIVLAQDAAVWNAQPLWEGMRLTASHIGEADTPVQSEAGQALFNRPNLLTAADWNDWLFLRSYNTITGEMLASAAIPLRASLDGNPLVVTAAAGQGKRTYVDLALSPQLLNIHAGAFRLLANLISY